MSEAVQVLAQATPSASTLTTLYTVSTTSAVVSSVVICNQNSTAQTFSISVAVAGASDTVKQYLYYQLPILANDTFIATIGISMANTDVLRCWANATNVSFNAFGVAIT